MEEKVVECSYDINNNEKEKYISFTIHNFQISTIKTIHVQPKDEFEFEPLYFFQISHGSNWVKSMKKNHQNINETNLLIYIENIENENDRKLLSCVIIQLYQCQDNDDDESEMMIGEYVIDISEFCESYEYKYCWRIEKKGIVINMSMVMVLRNFGKSIEDMYPFYQMFSREYQFEPLMRIVFSYLNGNNLLTIRIVSKYFYSVIKSLEFDVLYDVVDCDNFIRLINGYKIKCFEVNWLKSEYKFDVEIKDDNLKVLRIMNNKEMFSIYDVYLLINKFKKLENLLINSKFVEHQREITERNPNMLMENTSLKSLKLFLVNNSIQQIQVEEEIVKKCSNISILSVSKENGFFPERISEILYKRNFQVNKWSDEVEIELTKDKPYELFLDQNGFSWIIEMFEMGDDNPRNTIYLYQHMSFITIHKVFQASFIVRFGNIGYRKAKRCFFKTGRGYGFPFLELKVPAFSKYKKIVLLLSIKIKRVMKIHEHVEMLEKNREKVRLGKHLDDITLKIPISKIKNFSISSGSIANKSCYKYFSLNGMEWSLMIKQYEQHLFDLYFRNFSTKYYCFEANFRVLFNNKLFLERKEEIDTNKCGMVWGRLFQHVEQDDVLTINLISEVKKLYTIEEFVDVKRNKIEATDRLMKNKSIILNKWETSDIDLSLHPYDSSNNVFFNCLGLKWNILFYKKRGKYNRGAVFLSCVFYGKYYIRAEYEIKRIGADNSLKSTAIDYDEDRGWGFEECSLFNIDKPDKPCILKIRVRVLECFSNEEYYNYCKGIFENVTKMEDEITLTFKPQKDPVQTDAFQLCQIPYYVEFFPNGFHNIDLITLCLYYKGKDFYEVEGDYTISLNNNNTHNKTKSIVKRKSSKSYMIEFSNICKKDLSTDWILTIKLKILKITRTKNELTYNNIEE